MLSGRLRSRTILATATLAGVFAAGALLPVSAAVEGGDHVGWLVQPASASTGEAITSVIGDKNGPTIKVALYNGSGERLRREGIKITLEPVGVGCELMGTTVDDTNDNGVAEFLPKIGCEARDVRLRAFAADTGSETSGNQAWDDSAAFDIRDGQLTGCSASGCDDSDASGGTSVQVTAYTDGYLLLGIQNWESQLSCGSAYSTSSKLAVFDTTGTAKVRTVATMTLDASLVTRSHKQYDVCLEKPLATGGVKVSLLGDCDRKLKPEDVDAPNCVLERKREKDGDVRITISVKPGDPRFGF